MVITHNIVGNFKGVFTCIRQLDLLHLAASLPSLVIFH